MKERLTKSDIAKIEEELEQRKLVEREKISQEIKEARAQGDLSENFEYYAARRARGQNESRIAYLEKMVRNAEVIEEKASDENEVALNKPVDLYFPEDDEVQQIRLVTSIRGNSLKNLFSIESPIGQAILHHKEGDRVHVEIGPNMGDDVEIRKVYPAIDDSEDAIKGF